MATTPVLEIEALTLTAKTQEVLVNDISFSLNQGESLGLVGESGSGKSLTLRAVLGLLPRGVQQTGGVIRGAADSAMVFQDPRGALDPLCPVVKQVAEVVYYRQRLSRKASRAAALELLHMLGLPDSLRKTDRYPGQLSGGQCQRIVIAMALACKPGILLCDEPTTALDVTVQKQIMETVGRLQQELGFAMIFVTHNLAVAAAMCSRLAVMKKGEIVEQGSTLSVLQEPQNQYTQMLINSVLPVPELAPEGSGVLWT